MLQRIGLPCVVSEQHGVFLTVEREHGGNQCEFILPLSPLVLGSGAEVL